jgi:CheY-like chemotaxis protein
MLSWEGRYREWLTGMRVSAPMLASHRQIAAVRNDTTTRHTRSTVRSVGTLVARIVRLRRIVRGRSIVGYVRGSNYPMDPEGQPSTIPSNGAPYEARHPGMRIASPGTMLRRRVQRESRVLLMEHSPATMRSMERTLRGRYTVSTVGDSATALRFLLGDAIYDGIVCDLEMPRIDEVLLDEHLDHQRPGALATHLLLLGTEETVSRRGVALGGSVPVLLRPFANADLLEAVALITTR